MKNICLFVIALFAAITCQAQPASPASSAPAVKEAVNYIIHVEWKEATGNSNSLEILTAEGQFNLNTIQKNSVKINGSDIPITLKFSGTLTAMDAEKGRLQLFLGRTVPYVTGTVFGPAGSSSSYQQMSAGLDSNFLVKFGKSQTIQSDENGQITILVKRVDN